MTAAVDVAHRPDDPGSTIELTLPAEATFVRVARLVVAGLLADDGTGVDVVDDLRVAVDELLSLALDGDGDPSVHLTFRLNPGELRVDVRRSGMTVQPDLHPVSRSLLAATTDDVIVEHDGHTLTVGAVRRTADRR
ncbi:MAG: hypothetical protein JJU45_10605 [Acidimicrobiia bacterium]|nr:hypothetical protein [Acidimicrobiia bacterium]